MSLRRIIFDTTLLLEVANRCVESNILRMPCIPLHRLSVVSDCLLIVASRLGYRATVQVMLPDYWRRDYEGERADGKPDQRQSSRHFSIRQTAHCIYSNQQRAERKAGPAEPEEGKGSEKAPTRGVKDEPIWDHFRGTVIRGKVIFRKNLVPWHRLVFISQMAEHHRLLKGNVGRRQHAECDEDGRGKAERRNEKSKQNNAGNQYNNPKSAEREQRNMRDDSRVMEQRQLQTGKVRGHRILNPLKKSGTKNQKAGKDEQPISRP